MVYEKLKTHLWILSNGKDWQWEDFARSLNTKIIEIDPNRISRPLSNLVEVIDAKFRANLWDFIPPHPSLSLQWPFLFIGLPLLLFKFLKNIGCQTIIALCGTCLYLTSPGFLSPLVMLSHPAKSMVNFFSILSLATISQLYPTGEAKNISIKNVPHFWWIFISWLCWTMVAFLSDETGLFLYIILAFVCYPLFLKFKEKTLFLSCFLLLPVLYLIIIRLLLPWFHWIVNHKTVDLSNYRDHPNLSSLFSPNWHDFFTNAYLLFSDHPNLKWDFSRLLPHPFLVSVQCVYTLTFIFLIGIFIFTIYKTKSRLIKVKQILAGLILLVFYIFFHTFQLSHNVRVWPLFWYGCLFSLIYYVTLTLILQFTLEKFKDSILRKLLPFLILIFALHGLVSTTYRINLFKNQGMEPKTFYYPFIISGKLNPYQYYDFSKSLQKSRCRYIYTLLYWSKVKQKNIHPETFTNEIQSCSPIISTDPFFQAEALYFIIEASLEFPQGHSFLNNPSFVSTVVHQIDEPL